MQIGTHWEVVTWSMIRPEVTRINPTLAKLIDALNPDDTYKLVKASYQFGDLVVQDGVVQLPSKSGKLSAFGNSEIPAHVWELLEYSAIPLSLLLNKCSEVFIQEDERVIPVNIFKPGDLFGTFEVLDYFYKIDQKPIWNVSAGGRSTFTLPRIAEASGIKRLRHVYKLPSSWDVRQLSDHWRIFSHIAKHETNHNSWINQILFFTKKWFSDKNNSKEWLNFKDYVCRQSWHQVQFAISNISHVKMWQLFVRTISNRNLKPSIYIADTIKHLMLIAFGLAPGFRPADKEEQVLPTQLLQQAIIDVYKLQKYVPTLMHIDLLGKNNKLETLFYSLAYPTLLVGSPGSKDNSTIMAHLKEIKMMVDALRKLKKDGYVQRLAFRYFHIEDDWEKEIEPSKSIVESDNYFLNHKPDNGKEFCITSPFWRGCVQVNRIHPGG